MGANTWNAVSQSAMQGGNLIDQMVQQRLAAQAARQKAEQDRLQAELARQRYEQDRQDMLDAREQQQRNWAAEYALKIKERQEKEAADEEAKRLAPVNPSSRLANAQTSYVTAIGKDDGLVRVTGEGSQNGAVRAYDPADPKSIADWKARSTWESANATLADYGKATPGGLMFDEQESILADYGLLNTPGANQILNRQYRQEHDRAVLMARAKDAADRMRLGMARVQASRRSGSAEGKSAQQWQAEYDAAKRDWDELVLKYPDQMAGLNIAVDGAFSVKRSALINAQKGLQASKARGQESGKGSRLSSVGF